jgi:inner membrane protease ATP23
MVEHMAKKGCPVTPEFFSCRPCGDIPAVGGYVPDEGVVLCADNVRTQGEVTRTIRHELIHAFDHCRAHVDWNNLEHVACAEVRAQNLSGECEWFEEVNRGNIGLKKHHQECVRRRAELSVRQINPDPALAAAAVKKVFDRCFADTEPYNRIP